MAAAGVLLCAAPAAEAAVTVVGPVTTTVVNGFTDQNGAAVSVPAGAAFLDVRFTCQGTPITTACLAADITSITMLPVAAAGQPDAGARYNAPYTILSAMTCASNGSPQGNPGDGNMAVCRQTFDTRTWGTTFVPRWLMAASKAYDRTIKTTYTFNVPDSLNVAGTVPVSVASTLPVSIAGTVAVSGSVGVSNVPHVVCDSGCTGGGGTTTVSGTVGLDADASDRLDLQWYGTWVISGLLVALILSPMLVKSFRFWQT